MFDRPDSYGTPGKSLLCYVVMSRAVSFCLFGDIVFVICVEVMLKYSDVFLLCLQKDLFMFLVQAESVKMSYRNLGWRKWNDVENEKCDTTVLFLFFSRFFFNAFMYNVSS